jgi:hypothetical protein
VRVKLHFQQKADARGVKITLISQPDAFKLSVHVVLVWNKWQQ